MTRVELRYGAATDVGMVRAVNEDAYLAEPPVFVVADGMGGHDGGEVASGIVVEEFARIGDDRLDTVAAARRIVDALVASQARIGEFSAEHRAQGSPQWYSGTTVVVALLVAEGADAAWLVVNLGDSRAYRLSGGDLSQVTVDHSVVQELIDAGEIDPGDASLHPDRHVVTRALGGPEEVAPDFFLVPLADAERLLLCSDGVNGMIDDERIGAILREAPDPGAAADRLVAAAIEAGGRDNATAVVVDVVGWAP
ncbi:MAG: protein phosphatase 2C domain-containing protein [Nocardioides sp.]|uniref:PP2C family protein-serine/threonine phosphatase n=1 Tax=Nocardioides sp. TaxID=35761 RepID=UPI0039E46419